MTDRPILFSGLMVRALLDDRKTQTRRMLNPQPNPESVASGAYESLINGLVRPSPIRFAVGDRLWVRESYFQFGHWEPIAGARTKGDRQKWHFAPDQPEILFDAPAGYRKGRHNADPATPAWHKRLGRFMPRKASRLTLTVTAVRVQRLQDISEEDARAEGAFVGKASGRVADNLMALNLGLWHATARGWYADLWDRINGDGAWAANPFVAAYSFTVARGNIDELASAAAGEAVD